MEEVCCGETQTEKCLCLGISVVRPALPFHLPDRGAEAHGRGFSVCAQMCTLIAVMILYGVAS